MFPSGALRFRIIIIILLIFLVWQIIRMFPNFSYYTYEKTIDKPAGTPVVVAIFYEALCPDSKSFILKQLVHAYKVAPELIDYQLVPYGKAKTIVNPETGVITFECQHGPPECQANTIHACAIDLVSDVNLRLSLISCMIEDNILPDEALRSCSKRLNISPDQIAECSVSEHGISLLKEHGEATNALQPPVSFIPTITLDGSQWSQSAILKDLLAEVCRIEKGRGSSVPTPCL